MHFFKTADLRWRILSALVLAPATLLVTYQGGSLYALTVALIVTLGLREWLRLVSPQISKIVAGFAFASLLVIMELGTWVSVSFATMIGIILVLVLFLLAARDNDERAGWVAFGLPYMAGSGLAMIYLRATPHDGMGMIYYLLAAVWGTDIGAYVAGKLIGGPKLAPNISPNKTWAGLFGGMALAAVLGYCVALGVGVKQPLVGFGLAVLMAGVSQLGDLFESYVKRRSGVKESGGLIPGHGGILDRIDGLVFAAVFFVLFQIALGAHMHWW